MSDYHGERTTWTDGTGEIHDVIKVYVPDDDDDWAMYAVREDGTCERLIARSPVYMWTERTYATAGEVVVAVIQAHREWLASGDDYRRARGVLAKEQTR